MVADISLNGKGSYKERFSTISFQTIEGISIHKFNDKEIWKAAFNKRQQELQGQPWLTLVGVNKLIETINKGFTVKCGVSLKSNKAVDIEHFSIVYIDYDGFNKKENKPKEGALKSIDEALKFKTIKRYCSFYQLSFSNKPNCLSAHFFFILSRNVTEDEQQLIVKALNLYLTDENGNKEGFDDAITGNPNQICFSGKQPCVFVNEDVVLDVDYWINTATELGITLTGSVAKRTQEKKGDTGEEKKNGLGAKQTPASSEEIEEDDSITEKVLKAIYQDIVINHLNGDYKALYALFPHSWKESTRSLTDGEIEQLDSDNPFCEADGRDDSFTITLCDNGLPAQFYDRSCNFKSVNQGGYERNGGHIIEYFYALFKTPSGTPKYCKPVDGKWVLDSNSLKGRIFFDVVKDIYSHFSLKIDLRKFRSSKKKKNESESDDFDEKIKEIVEACEIEFKGKFFMLADRFYYAYVPKLQHWKLLEGIDYPYDQVFSEYISDTFGGNLHKNKKVKQAVIDNFKVGHSRSGKPQEDYNYVPLKNGLLNIFSKELIENKGQIYNEAIYPWGYKDEKISNNDPDIVYLDNYLTEWINSDVKSRLLLNWLILCVQRQAWRTTKMLGVIGASGKGKTSYGLLIHNLINGRKGIDYSLEEDFALYSEKPNSDRITSDYSHATASLEGKTHIFLEELKGEVGNNSLKVLKELSGNIENRSLNVNQKNQKERTVPFYGAITFDSENIPKIDPKQKGYFRRMVFIEIDDTCPGESLVTKCLPQIYTNLEKICMWCLQQDTNEIVKQFLELANHVEMQQAVWNIRMENDTMLQFVSDHFEFTENDEDFVSIDTIYNFYNNICLKYGYGKPFTNNTTFGKFFRPLLSESRFHWSGKKTVQRVNGDPKNVYTRLKFKDSGKLT